MNATRLNEQYGDPPALEGIVARWPALRDSSAEVWPETFHKSGLVLERDTIEFINQFYSFETERDRRLVYSFILPGADVVIAGRAAVSEIIEIHPSMMMGEHSAISIIRRIVQKYLPEATVSGYIPGTYARTLGNLDQAVSTAVRRRLESDLGKGRNELSHPTFVATARPYNSNWRQQRRSEKTERVVMSADPIARKAQLYLNGLSGSSFRWGDNALLNARRAAQSMECRARAASLRTIRCIEFDPAPVYSKSSPRSPRLHAIGSSLQNAPKWLRRTLGANWLELDLQNASMAIAQRLFGLEELGSLLERSGSVWEHLYVSHQMVGSFPAFKKAAKQLMISALMGAQKRSAARFLRDTYQAESGHKLDIVSTMNLLDDPAFCELFEARHRFRPGVPLKFRDGSQIDTTGLTAKNIVSQAVFSAEWRLLEPAIDLAIRESQKKKPIWRIVLWQHDGFSIQTVSKDEDRQRAIARRVQSAVADRAAQLGMRTELTLDYAWWKTSPVTENINHWHDLL